jgi:hypothetical protein
LWLSFKQACRIANESVDTLVNAQYSYESTMKIWVKLRRYYFLLKHYNIEPYKIVNTNKELPRKQNPNKMIRNGRIELMKTRRKVFTQWPWSGTEISAHKIV